MVKISHFGTKDVNDYIVRVDEHPVPSRKPLDTNVPIKSLFDLVGKLNGHRCDLPCRTSGGYHHVVGNVGLSGQWDGHDLLGLVVVKRLKNELVEVFDVNGSAAGFAGGFNGLFGQGVSWRTMAGRVGPRAKRARKAGGTNGGLARE